ncbi:hypothetical protein GCM10022268_17640 [Sphingomonas cynarae]|uniref:DUF11 domain-containing protein n=2 Tax=Sphingomonas cynarae TaxID=930197 RepID=A0ABP7DS79_9SPHN
MNLSTKAHKENSIMSPPALRYLLSGGTAIAALAAATPTLAQTAAVTPAGTIVSNTAQATYTVNGNAQTTPSNTATFVVDRKVNLAVVAAQSATTSVNFGDTSVITTFRVTNNTNATQDFLLTLAQLMPVGLLTGADNFDLDNVRIVVDVDGDGLYDPAVDTATFIDELETDKTRAVFVIGDIPSNNPAATGAQIGLQAIAATGGARGTQGTPLIPTPLNTVNQDAEIDVVFADNDNDGLLGYDAARNGRAWAYASFAVTTTNVSLTVTKSASVVSDGISTLNPKALPGAIVQYCLTVQNATPSTAAANVNLTDIVPANTTYIPGSLSVGGIGANGVCLLNGVSIADNGSGTGAYRGSYDAGTRTVTATIASVPGGTSVAASFRVTID